MHTQTHIHVKDTDHLRAPLRTGEIAIISIDGEDGNEVHLHIHGARTLERFADVIDGAHADMEVSHARDVRWPPA